MTEAARQEPSIDALVFDVGGVIVGHDNRRMFEQLATRCASPDVSVTARKVEAAIGDPKWEKGDAPVADLYQQLRTDLGYRGDWSTFLEDWTCHFTLDHSMIALLTSLRTVTRVILFSNTNEEHWAHLLAAYPGALDPFERYLSHEIGLSKPSRASFQYVADAAGIVPARTMFFDDRSVNVEGARHAGFKAEVFRNCAYLCAQLAAAGLALPPTA